MTGPPCPDCGWSPPTGALWPSEGRTAVRWISDNIICGEGDWYGQRMILRPDQKRSLYRWYEYCPRCGRWRYQKWLRSEATGGGKTTFVAAIEVLELLGPPQVSPVSPNIVNAAGSWEQANRLFSAAGIMCGGQGRKVLESPLREYCEVYDSKIVRSDGRPGEIVRVAAVAGTNEGGLPSLFVCDEVHEWGDIGDAKARVHVVIGKSTRKRRLRCEIPGKDGKINGITRGPGRIIDISTAGFDVEHSMFGAMYAHGKRAERDPAVDPGLLFEVWEAPEGLDFDKPADREAAVRAASPAAGILWDVADRVRSWADPELAHHEWRRYYANQWVDVADESWLADHPAAWGKCQGTWEIQGDEPTVLAVDMSLKRDSTAVAECALLGDGRVAVTARIWDPADGNRRFHGEVKAFLMDRAAELGERFHGVVYDPRFFELIAEQLEEEDIEVIQFDQTAALMSPACGETYDAIIAGMIVHDGDREFARQVKAAVKRQQERGFTLSKGKSKRRIDAAVAMCMGVWAVGRYRETDIAGTVW